MESVNKLLERIQSRQDGVKDIRARLKSLKADEEDLVLEVKNIDEKKIEKKEVKISTTDEERKKFSESFPLSVTCGITEKTVDETRRTVIAGILQENSLSANKRFYPASVVRKAVKTLEGKRSLIGHDTNNPADIVAKIDRAFIKGGVAYGEFKFGTDSVSESILSKIKEGLIDSTSIRASGETRRGKIGNEFVDVVEKLDIASVDWVVEGGVEAAKVTQVFESSPTIVYDNSTNINEEEKQRMEDLKKVQEQLDAQNKKMEELTKQNEELSASKDESDKKLAEQKLSGYKTEKLSAIKDDVVREAVKKNLCGASEKEIDVSFKEQVEMIGNLLKSSGSKGSEIKILPTDGVEEDKDLKFHDANEFFESKDVSVKDKEEAFASML